MSDGIGTMKRLMTSTRMSSSTSTTNATTNERSPSAAGDIAALRQRGDRGAHRLLALAQLLALLVAQPAVASSRRSLQICAT